jgi:lambda family phage portal protein
MTDASANLLDRAIAQLSPGWALKRATARRILAYYEAAKPDTLRKQRREPGSGDTAVYRAGSMLREQARHLEQNHDLARGALATLIANIVGPNGIGIEPQPRGVGGEIDDDLSRQILSLWRDWQQKPEVTWCMDWPALQRLACRTWLRDGEVLTQILEGTVPLLDHGTKVPLSLELIEADHLPWDLQSTNPTITAGVERNAWGRPVAFHVYKQHPGDIGLTTAGWTLETKRVPAANMLHLKLSDRVRQARGVSVFAAVLARLDDIKDYEESERIAAKVAASMAAVIKKGTPDMYEPNPDGTARDMKFRPGMVFDDLLPGESVETIDSKRPNPQLEPFRNGQLRAVASGIGCTYSSLSKNYDGTYSAQRQELVEGWGLYGVLSSEFIGQFVRPVYQRFIRTAIAAGLLRVPAGVDPDSLDDALFLPPQMPWIDPLKEASGWEKLEANGHASGPEIIRRRGQSPMDVLEQEARWRRLAEEKGVSLSLGQSAAAPAPADAPDNTNALRAHKRTA